MNPPPAPWGCSYCEAPMLLQPDKWYLLPDGTRVQARNAGGGALRFEDMHGTPLYHYLPGALSLYHMVFDPTQRVYYAAACDLTLDDLIPTPPLAADI